MCDFYKLIIIWAYMQCASILYIFINTFEFFMCDFYKLIIIWASNRADLYII